MEMSEAIKNAQQNVVEAQQKYARNSFWGGVAGFVIGAVAVAGVAALIAAAPAGLLGVAGLGAAFTVAHWGVGAVIAATGLIAGWIGGKIGSRMASSSAYREMEHAAVQLNHTVESQKAVNGLQRQVDNVEQVVENQAAGKEPVREFTTRYMNEKAASVAVEAGR